MEQLKKWAESKLGEDILQVSEKICFVGKVSSTAMIVEVYLARCINSSFLLPEALLIRQLKNVKSKVTQISQASLEEVKEVRRSYSFASLQKEVRSQYMIQTIGF